MYRTAHSKTIIEHLVRTYTAALWLTAQAHVHDEPICNTVDSRQGAQFSSMSQSVTWYKLKMSATEEDTELRDLLIQNLENSGVLNKIKVLFLSISKHA